MPISIDAVAELEYTPGDKEAGWFARDSPAGKYAAVFEDDGDTGYLYAYDIAKHQAGVEDPIYDAMHIYNVRNIADRHPPSKLQIGWSRDGLKAILIINGYGHAVFDFAAKRGYCRTGFPPPPPDGEWTRHIYSDAVLDLFEENS
jgi:hypothetical protein